MRPPGVVLERGERGTALVELALVLPVFALMLFAIFQFGLLFTGWAQLRNSVQAGARMASMGSIGYGDANCPDVVGYASSAGSATKEMVCQIEALISQPVGTDAGTPVKVALSVDHQDNTVTVCALAKPQALTGFFPSVPLVSASEFYLQAATPDLQDYDPYGQPIGPCS